MLPKITISRRNFVVTKKNGIAPRIALAERKGARANCLKLKTKAAMEFKRQIKRDYPVRTSWKATEIIMDHLLRNGGVDVEAMRETLKNKLKSTYSEDGYNHILTDVFGIK